jgi:hypothetical protein
MNNSSCSTNVDETVGNRASNSTFDSTKNQGDLREVRNQGDMRDVTENGGNRDRINMTRS